MPRWPRITPAGFVYHVLNRGNDRRRLFNTAADYDNFRELLAEAAKRFLVRLCAYCLMPNHWHLLLWPEEDNAIPKYLHRVTWLHAKRVRAETGTIGHGHVYQGRYRHFPVQTERYFWRVTRYVEANALRAGLVSEAQAWRWTSLRDRGNDTGIIVPGPLPMPDEWVDIVNTAIPSRLLERVRVSAQRGRPFGSDEWTIKTARQLHIEHTLRNVGGQRASDRSVNHFAA